MGERQGVLAAGFAWENVATIPVAAPIRSQFP